MVRRDNNKSRVTPKGTVSTPASDGPGAAGGSAAVPAAHRPSGTLYEPSPTWVPVLMFTLLALGVLVILANYVFNGFLGMPSNWYLVAGLLSILAGIIVATRLR